MHDRRRPIFWGGRPVVALLALGLLLVGCDKAPVSLGFMGGLTGPAADLGTGGRDGALLAVEQINQQGGLLGARVKLHEFDDQQQPGRLPGLMEAVQKAGVVALVGPMTSSVAKAWIPLTDQARLLSISPTVTSSDFTGHDDYFFRVISDTRSYARASATHYTERQHWSRFAVIFDETNAAYTRSWLQHFQQAMQERGVALVSATGFGLPQSPSLTFLAQQTLLLQPDALVLIANATDSAQIAQLVRKKDQQMPIIATEWSATAQLLLLGGTAVEGLRIAQFMDHQSQEPGYLKFVADFQQRFGRAPGFAEVAAYDAMRVLLEALAQQHPDESTKASLLRIRQFKGLQQSVVLDDFGDSSRRVVMTEVKAGRYQVLGGP